jgi:transcriptional regulator with XRE-family HTH domain
MREAAGLSQAEVSRRIKVSQSVVVRIESGNHEPRIGTLKRIAKVCGYTVLVQFVPDSALSSRS